MSDAGSPGDSFEQKAGDENFVIRLNDQVRIFLLSKINQAFIVIFESG